MRFEIPLTPEECEEGYVYTDVHNNESLFWEGGFIDTNYDRVIPVFPVEARTRVSLEMQKLLAEFEIINHQHGRYDAHIKKNYWGMPLMVGEMSQDQKWRRAIARAKNLGMKRHTKTKFEKDGFMFQIQYSWIQITPKPDNEALLMGAYLGGQIGRYH